jgi:hypothetical protein
MLAGEVDALACLASLSKVCLDVITMKARLIRIGNSRGIRARAGWAEAVLALGADPATKLDAAAPTRFDGAEWHW